MADARRTVSAPAARVAIVSTLLVALVALAAVVALERWGWAGRARTAGEPERLWIWAAGDLRDARPLVFYARRDFELSAPPTRATLTLLGDEEYVVSLNGHRVGSNRYFAGAALDRYEVAPLLAAGRNRLVVELRSATGAGGLTLRLEDGDGRALAATGPDWAIHRDFHRGLFAGGRIPPGEAPRILGRQPLGRWGAAAAGPPRPRFESLLAVDAVLRARAERRDRSGDWRRASRRGAQGPSLGPVVEFDFGVPVVGYLQLTVRGVESDAALLRFGLEPTDGGPGHDALALTARGAGVWQDALPRRFRYVEVSGLERVTSAGVLPLVESAPDVLGGDRAQPTPFGVAPPPLRTPVEDEIRRQLERAPGLGIGEAR